MPMIINFNHVLVFSFCDVHKSTGCLIHDKGCGRLRNPQNYPSPERPNSNNAITDLQFTLYDASPSLLSSLIEPVSFWLVSSGACLQQELHVR